MDLAREIPKSMQTLVNERISKLKIPSKTSSPAKPKQQRAADFGRPRREELKPQSPQKGMKRKKSQEMDAVEKDDMDVDSDAEDM